ncbi:tRNA lysidine(34) synthetase TilS [Streptococcus hongkongensis]|nr:tRNA(Ile)-lysidine synthase [Streptococcus uberis]
MTYQKIYNYIKQKGLFDQHKRVLIAVSGGVDSMNLLHFLHLNQNNLQIAIAIIHVNHKQRPESDQEEEYLENWAKEKQIPFYKADFFGSFSENNARDFRYSFFKKIMENENYSALVTAHHADDQAETVFMRLLRGARLRHLSSIKECQSFGSGQLIRPFLTISKADLPKIFHFEDASNQTNEYLRNRIRNQYLPELRQENPQFNYSLLALSKESSVLIQALKDLIPAHSINQFSYFLNNSTAVQYFCFQEYIEQFSDLSISKSQFEELLSLLRRKKTGTYPINQTYQLVISYDSFLIEKISLKTERKDSQVLIEYGTSNKYNNCTFTFSHLSQDIAHELMIPIYQLSPITLRGRMTGDIIDFGQFSKKIRRLFIDGKFTAKERENAIIGLQKDEIIFVLIADKTYLRKASKHDIMLAKLYVENLEKR